MHIPLQVHDRQDQPRPADRVFRGASAAAAGGALAGAAAEVTGLKGCLYKSQQSLCWTAAAQPARWCQGTPTTVLRSLALRTTDLCMPRTTNLSIHPNLPAFPSPSPCLPQAAGLAAAPPAALSGNPVGAAAAVALHVVGRL